MALHESAEMYLETIYQLSLQQQSVRSIDVAEHTGYSKPSISRAIGLLKQGGYVIVDEDGFLQLTDSGLEVAKKVFERHTIVSRFLVKLGVDEETAVEDACKIEHVISNKSFEAIKQHIKQFQT